MSPLNITQPLDSIRYMVYNGYYKVMSNIPKMGHLTTPEKRKENGNPWTQRMIFMWTSTINGGVHVKKTSIPSGYLAVCELEAMAIWIWFVDLPMNLIQFDGDFP